MKRLRSYTSVFGHNWVTGRSLFPVLSEWGGRTTGVVLDLGCGESPYRSFFPKAEPYLRVDRFPSDPGVLAGDLLNIPLENSTVDSVLLFQSLTDVAEPGACLLEAGRVLREGGDVIVFESLCYPEHDLPDDYYRIMPEGLRYLAEKNGFVLADLRRLGGIFSRFSMLWNLLMRRVSHYPVLGLLSAAGIAAGNLLFFALDRVFPFPRFAPDYCARLVKR